MRNLICMFAAFAMTSASFSSAQETAVVTGGQSSVTLDQDSLAGVGLLIAGFSDEVAEDVDGARIFTLNGRDDPDRPTTFEYTPSGEFGLFPVSGRGEHGGSVFFQTNLLGINSIGGFSIGYDAARESALNSGFFIESTEGFSVILFDIQTGDDFVITPETQVVVGGLLGISPELNAILPVPVNVTGSIVGTWSFNGTAAGLVGDLNGDGSVDGSDIDRYIGQLGLPPVGDIANLDVNGDAIIDSQDVEFLIENFVMTSNGQTGTFLGDLNFDGSVDVLGDAFILVANLGNPATSYVDGDINLDGEVTVLGDAFALVANLGRDNE